MGRTASRSRALRCAVVFACAGCTGVARAPDDAAPLLPPTASTAPSVTAKPAPPATQAQGKPALPATTPAPAPVVAAPLETPLAPRAPRGDDPLAVGDEVRIVVVGQADLSTQLPVPPRGSIELPVIGSLALAGRTAGDVARELRERLEAARFMVSPEVAVSVVRFAARRVFVVEGVARPEAYELPVGAGLHLTQVIALAGGLSAGADPSHVTILRRPRDGAAQRIAVDLRAILDSDRVDLDPILEQDDTVIVRDLKQGEQSVFVTGKVRTPSSYRFSPREGITFLQAIVLAGGLDKYANPARAALLRRTADGRITIPVDLERILAGDLERDLPLQAGDVVFVPESFF
ncbi:MAG: SLBB domain-containing protein [Planctomycetes bacterium]|nr:SLBB domain-containing protein [Planctomycetota bacterium]